jgi:hypothetical protein
MCLVRSWLVKGIEADRWNSLAPYERRVIELLRNSKDKRARKLAKKRVCLPSRSWGG